MHAGGPVTEIEEGDVGISEGVGKGGCAYWFLGRLL
jgi:hypothetical protein